ncbi:MAG: SDR family NAD(P)-dependent oxidoreductase [Pseudomonadota bacterium]
MKSVVITGGNKGLGLAQTRCFLDNGFAVTVVARTRGELDSLAHDRLTWHEHDLSNWADVSYLDTIHARTGGIDALVNNAGVHLKLPAWEVEADALDRVLDINVKAMFRACGRFCDLNKDRGGAIVNISSMGGLMALPSAAAYVTAKTAVIGLTRSVAVDGAARGIRCNAVCPGFIDTDMTRAVLAKDPARREKIEGRIPTHQFGTPENVADAVHFLASDASAYINGTALPVDGGYAIGF